MRVELLLLMDLSHSSKGSFKHRRESKFQKHGISWEEQIQYIIDNSSHDGCHPEFHAIKFLLWRQSGDTFDRDHDTSSKAPCFVLWECQTRHPVID